jgi:hypothetical protein
MRVAALLLLMTASARAAVDLLLAPGVGEGCLTLAGGWRLDGEGHAVALGRPLPPSRCPASLRLPEPAEAGARAAERLFVFDAMRPERLLAFALRATARPSWRPETGMWWRLDAERGRGAPGSGLFLEVQGEAISVWLATYDEAGRAEWWMAAGELDGAVFHGELLAFAGGPPAFRAPDPPHSARSAGQIAMRFHGPARAEVWIARADDGGLVLHAFEAARFVFGMSPGAAALAGEWEWSAGEVPPSPLRLSLRPLHTAAGELLADASRWIYLRCEAAPEGVPARCALFAIGGIAALAEFDAVGLNLLSGRDAEGREHQLRRMAPPPRDDRENPPRAADAE